MHA
ncbi:unnamed protein product [Cuscuta europaea]|jgi:hypothetical protein